MHRPFSIVLVFATLALAAPLAAAGPPFPVARASVAPTIDGYLDSVWNEATLQFFGEDVYNVTIRVLHDERTLYLAFEDLTNAATPGHDEFWISIDEEGGAPPKRWDGLWGPDVCDADYPEESEEGAWGWIYDEGFAIDERWRQNTQVGACADQTHLGFTHAVVSAPEFDAVRLEVAIPIDGTGTIEAEPGDEFAFYAEVFDDVWRVGFWPNMGEGARAQLAVLGCNVAEGEEFDPGFPLDWEVTGSGAAIWKPSGTSGGECGIANSTGSSGDSACVFYNGSLDGAASALNSPWFSLSRQTSATLSYRGVYAESPGNAQSHLVLEVTTDGSTWSPILDWTSAHGVSGGEAVEADLSAYAGQPHVRLRWRFAMASGVTGGAQVDDVKLVCDPFLFADGFESSFTTAWSDETP